MVIPNQPVSVILTHEHTDFDALASMLAAARFYPHATPVLPRQMNRNLEAFLAEYARCCRLCGWRTCQSAASIR